MSVSTPPHRPAYRHRPLNERQIRKRMAAVLDEIATLGSAYQLSAGHLRRRMLLLERQGQETLDQWPRG